MYGGVCVVYGFFRAVVSLSRYHFAGDGDAPIHDVSVSSRTGKR